MSARDSGVVIKISGVSLSCRAFLLLLVSPVRDSTRKFHSMSAIGRWMECWISRDSARRGVM